MIDRSGTLKFLEDLSVRDRYSQEIEALNQDLLRMAFVVEEAIHSARKALQDPDPTLAELVIAGDPGVNALELAITDRCVLLIATEQPVAGDLRRIIACLKAVSNIERIGDYAVHAAKRARELAEEEPGFRVGTLGEMLALGARMVTDAVTSLVHADTSLARRTAQRDSEMDQLYHKVYRELLDRMLDDRKSIRLATKLLFLGRVLERMGDHAVTICGWTLYAVTGVHEDL
jgi:phosphate transport system protein